MVVMNRQKQQSLEQLKYDDILLRRDLATYEATVAKRLKLTD